MFKVALCVGLVFITNGGLAAPSEDLITHLPGLAWKPNFKQYSGYLPVSDTKKLHYWLTLSENDPKSDPVVLWLNGGPGCSSLIGLLTENGPFRVAEDGKHLSRNPYAWNRIANILFLEAPAGVGFSYSDDGHYVSNDDITAKDNHQALRQFFRKFPEYTKNDFYITGESYGGMYVPTLASLVMDDASINLKGFAVGNGYSDRKKNDNSIVYFLKYHGVFGTDTWVRLWEACCRENKSTDYCDFVEGSKKSASCKDRLHIVAQLAWTSGLDPYNLYEECAGGVKGNLTLRYDPIKKKFITSNFGYPFMFLDNEISRMYELARSLPADKIEVDPPCTNGSAMTTYLNNPNVRKALHIPKKVQPYAQCSSSLRYTQLYDTMTPQYEKAIKSGKLRIYVYNGDVDMGCNYLGDEWFVDKLHIKNPKARTTWYYTAEDGTKQIAGYFKTYDSSKVTFLTVKGSGHFVPHDKPRPALNMFKSFLSGKPLSEN